MPADAEFPQPGPRIAVLGVTASGKTTVASRLSQILGIPHVELDSIHWGPNWAKPDPDDFRRRVGEALAGPAWVTDGNYSEARPVVWQRATTLVWLDYGLPVIYWQLIGRTLRRILSREELWNGNRETFRDAFFSKDSLFLYAYSSRKRQRTNYPKVFLQPEHAHLQVIHLKSRGETKRWLEKIQGLVSNRDIQSC
jgi:adenylate kinase family enzyme